ncbi:MSMEG_1061 family FMN-dependent PPOX-type flavoprotein [Humitalea sp. 24SJ18S-53]|uniref:MSMEG_1061 family FMN-dependent PPOX-type flavoprotein n=1 Tax=Humitalea sp. 24SJ18S-53 TaxID=3422307 RepID=UPI003D6741C2
MSQDVTTQEALAALYDTPRDIVLAKVTDRIEATAAAFIAASPFCILATSGARGLHATPRGDAPGFVTLLDDGRLALPDRRGNNRIDALRDIIDDPRVALLFLVPGAGEGLRITGTATISTDPALLARFAVAGKAPVTVLLVTAAQVFMQCQRAVIRSGLWGDRARPAVPTAGIMLAAHTGGMVDAAAYDADMPERVAASLY